MNRWYLIALICFSACKTGVKAQQYAGLSIDNDLFFGKDYYYSSGVFLQYGKTVSPYEKPRAADKFFKDELENKQRKSIHWRLGQQIFNPIGRYDSISDHMDYPFSGYLFLERSEQTHKSDKEILSWGLQLGLSGPPSLSQPIQNTYHRVVLGLPPLSWVDQQAAGLHLGVFGAWTKSVPLFEKVQFTQQMKAALGTHQSFAQLRTGLQWGPLNPLVFFNPLISPSQKGWSAHIGARLSYHAQDYNLSGSLFNDRSPFTLSSNICRNSLEAGFALRIEQWQFMTIAKTRSRDTPTQRYERHQVLFLSAIHFW